MRTLLFIFALAIPLAAQQPLDPTRIDPTRNLRPSPALTHKPLPEHYLWTANDITARRPDHNKFPWNRPDLRIAPHYFRTSFPVKAVSTQATLYIAGPRSARVWINGALAATFNSDISAPIGFHVFHADIASYLKSGPNTLAIEAIRGRGIIAATGSIATQQITYGEVLAAKIIPAAFGTEAPALVYSAPQWKSTAAESPNWQQPTFDDTAWPPAATLGPIESDPDLMQWNADAGMYEWPGYLGMSPALRTLPLAPVAVTHIYEGLARFNDPKSLTQDTPFTIASFTLETDQESPAILLDFGREIAGRLLVQSTSPCESTISLAYGESELEALATGLTPDQRGGNYLGTNLLHIPPRGIARGPKSAFRYARIRFLRGCPTLTFASIRAEAIYYPVTYAGSFESSDPLLNRIWETGAYTVHLCMQDGIWDAPKRDRGRWVGDLDIEGRVISTVFGDTALLEDTLNHLADETPPGQHVNGIPSYSALWVTSLESLYMHSGDKVFLASQHDHLLQILATIDKSLDPDGHFTNPKHQWLFVDWAPGLYAYTPDAALGTQLQFMRAYQAAGTLLAVLNDPAALVPKATPIPSNFGRTWQLNALANLIGARTSLPEINQDNPSDPVISPYFNAYLLDALSLTNRSQEALAWLRTYWGGMLAEGATSFWEAYDLRWPKTTPHLSLEADGTSGFFVSLAHGWSSGPTAWLAENVLGIKPTAPGYSEVSIAPKLLGLDWVRGSVATPHGPIAVSIDQSKNLTLTLPPGVTATVKWNGRTSTLTGPATISPN